VADTGIDILLQPPTIKAASLTFGTIETGEAGLVVRIDGDTDPLPFMPISLVSGLRHGDRVALVRQDRTLVIIGQASGSPTAGDTEVKTVNNIPPNSIGNVQVTVEIDSSAYDLIGEKDPRAMYVIRD
jgi:hypothetical protein